MRRGENIEIIEDIVPVYDIQVEIRIPEKVTHVRCVPQMEELDFTQDCGVLSYTVPKVECHQMVMVTYEKP